MDRQYVEKHQIADKYVKNLLSDKERAEFEVYFMDKPELLEQLEIDTLLAEGLQVSNVIPMSNSNIESTNEGSTLNRWMPMAASVSFIALAGSLSFNVTQHQRSEDLKEELRTFNSVQPNIPILNLSPVRGRDLTQQWQASSGPIDIKNIATASQITVRQSTITIVVNVQLSIDQQLDSTSNDEFPVKLYAMPNRNLIADFGSVIPMGAGDLSLGIPASLLPEGVYAIEVSGGTEAAVVIPLRIVKKP